MFIIFLILRTNEVDGFDVGHKSSINQTMVAYMPRVKATFTSRSKTVARLIVNNLNVSKGHNS